MASTTNTININYMNKNTLQGEIRKFGGKVTGTVNVLRQRLQRFRDNSPISSDYPYGKVPVTRIVDVYNEDNPTLQDDKKKDDKKEFFNEDCCICLEKITPQCRRVRIPCQHRFHQDCIKKWLKQDTRCPLCRQETNKKKPRKQPVANTYVESIMGNNLLPPIQEPLIQRASRPQLRRSDTESREFMNRMLLDSALDQQRRVLRNIDIAQRDANHNQLLVLSIDLADITRRIRRLMN